MYHYQLIKTYFSNNIILTLFKVLLNFYSFSLNCMIACCLLLIIRMINIIGPSALDCLGILDHKYVQFSALDPI